MTRFPLPLALIVAGMLAVSASTAGTSGGGWTRVSDPGAAGSVGLARTGNGTLHVVWAKDTAAFDSRITAAGKPGGRSSVVSGC